MHISFEYLSLTFYWLIVVLHYDMVFQVIVAAIRNRKLSVPENSNELYEIDDKERDASEEAIAHTSQFR